jgi:uncharacterized protein YndB with AHSA1/START domain
VRAAVEIAAPPEQVFRALTDPEQLAAWWGSGDSYRTREWRVDARPGGAWSARTTDAAGADGVIGGEVRVVDPPRVLEYTWRASWDPLATTVVRYELAPATVRGVSGTRLTVTHAGFDTGSPTGVTCWLGAGTPSVAEWARALASLTRHAAAAARGGRALARAA